MQDTFNPFELLKQQKFCQRPAKEQYYCVFIYNFATSHKNGVAAEWHSTVPIPPHMHVLMYTHYTETLEVIVYVHYVLYGGHLVLISKVYMAILMTAISIHYIMQVIKALLSASHFSIILFFYYG